MVTKADAYPDVAIHPGEYLAEEIGARDISQKELAKRMGRPLNAINEIINGKKAITAETALQLEEVMPEIPALIDKVPMAMPLRRINQFDTISVVTTGPAMTNPKPMSI